MCIFNVDFPYSYTTSSFSFWIIFEVLDSMNLFVYNVYNVKYFIFDVFFSNFNNINDMRFLAFHIHEENQMIEHETNVYRYIMYCPSTHIASLQF